MTKKAAKEGNGFPWLVSFIGISVVYFFKIKVISFFLKDKLY